MLMIAATSCKKYLDVNQNEDLPSVVPPKVLLPSTEASLAYSMGAMHLATSAHSCSM